MGASRCRAQRTPSATRSRPAEGAGIPRGGSGRFLRGRIPPLRLHHRHHHLLRPRGLCLARSGPANSGRTTVCAGVGTRGRAARTRRPSGSTPRDLHTTAVSATESPTTRIRGTDAAGEAAALPDCQGDHGGLKRCGAKTWGAEPPPCFGRPPSVTVVGRVSRVLLWRTVAPRVRGVKVRVAAVAARRAARAVPLL